MKRYFINDNKLKKYEIEDSVVRVKAFIVNDNNEVLLVFNNNTYQFPGGHKNKDEALEAALKREVKEELGIDNIKLNYLPFLCITTYDCNYIKRKKKIENTIYYYRIDSSIKPDINKINLSDLEKNSLFRIEYVNIKKLRSFLNKKLKDGSIIEEIAREMLIAVDSYFKTYKED